MGFDTACIEQKQLLRTCFAANNFITRMMRECDDVQKDYDTCIDAVVEQKKKENLELGRQRLAKWKANNKDIGI